MADKVSKGQSYRELFRRMDDALERHFYLEASWLAYAIIEDRIISALEKTGGVPTNRHGDVIRMLGAKIKELQSRIENDSDLKGAMLGGVILDSVDEWKEARNPMMHSLATEAVSFNEWNNVAQSLANNGKKVSRDLADAVTRLRKRKSRRV